MTCAFSSAAKSAVLLAVAWRKVVMQRGTDLATWTSGPDVAYVSEAHNADGTSTYVWRSAYPMGGANVKEFLRLRVTKP